jgi:hypothetical protein
MAVPSNEPIRLSERQTEMLTRALVEAAQEAKAPKASETDILKKPAPKLIRHEEKSPKKVTNI